MATSLWKLHPEHTLQLRGFDHFGAAAAIHATSETAFTVSGVFRDAADFAVLTLYDADTFYEHPRLKPLPDFDFSALTLQFDIRSSGLVPLQCGQFPTIDWPYLDVERPDGSRARIRLSDHATPVAGADTPARASFQFTGDSLEAWDRVTLWHQNAAFDYIVPGPVRAAFSFPTGTPGQPHSVLVRDRVYTYTEQPGDTSAAVAAQLASMLYNDPEITAAAADTSLRIERRLDDGGTVPISWTGGDPVTLHNIKTATVVRALRDQINAAGALIAEADGSILHLRTAAAGYDMNFVSMYATWKNDRLRTVEREALFTGGESDTTLRVTLDFAALGVPLIRTLWLTFAPRLQATEDFVSTEWSAEFTNWTLSGPESKRRLRAAGAGSVRIHCTESACVYQGPWVAEEGFFHGGLARGAHAAGDSVTVRYSCEHPHSLWLGTSLAADRGRVAVSLDGLTLDALDCRLDAQPAVNTRREVAPLVAPGEHTVTLSLLDDKPVYFDFLEAVVAVETVEDLPAQSDLSAALDYSTDHTYKLPPARIVRQLKSLGLAAPVNEYLGVFWWNQRKREGGSLASAQFEFSAGFSEGDQVFLDIGGQLFGKTVFPHDTPESVALHFTQFINGASVGVVARCAGAILTLTARSAAPAYAFPVRAWVEPASGSTASVSPASAALDNGAMGDWVIDVEAEPALNLAARCWHADLYAKAAQAGLEVTTAISMELVNPPEHFAARFPDGTPVLTSVGFASLHSTHCAFRDEVRGYQARVLKELAASMALAGLPPRLQLGEFCWWYFAQNGMAYYDDATRAAAVAHLGRDLALFTAPTDDPAVNGGADAAFLAQRLREHVAALVEQVRSFISDAQFEILFPCDVNHPVPAGVHGIGGRLNRAVNLPPEWTHPSTAGFDRMKLESLDFGAWSRNLDLVRTSLDGFLGLGWPPSQTGLMAPAFRVGYPWESDVAWARSNGFSAIHLWAFDHVCLYGLDVSQRGVGSAKRFG